MSSSIIFKSGLQKLLRPSSPNTLSVLSSVVSIVPCRHAHAAVPKPAHDDVIDNRPFPVGVATAIGRRDYNEDRTLVKRIYVGEHKMLLVGIFDGHGGHAASDFVSKVLPEVLIDCIGHDGLEGLENALRQTFNIVNQWISGHLIREGSLFQCILHHQY